MRRYARRRRAALPAPLRGILAAIGAARLGGWPVLAKARTVAAFASFGDEIDTGPLLRLILAAGQRLALPVIDRTSRTMRLRLVADLTALAPGIWGIPQPDAACPRVRPAELDLIIAPGLAFDRYGNRLGYGGGYYDALLQAARAGRRRPRVCGYGFQVQVFGQVPVTAGDQPVDYLATENGISRARLGGPAGGGGLCGFAVNYQHAPGGAEGGDSR